MQVDVNVGGIKTHNVCERGSILRFLTVTIKKRVSEEAVCAKEIWRWYTHTVSAMMSEEELVAYWLQNDLQTTVQKNNTQNNNFNYILFNMLND